MNFLKQSVCSNFLPCINLLSIPYNSKLMVMFLLIAILPYKNLVAQEADRSIQLDNGKISIEINKETGALESIRDNRSNKNLLVKTNDKTSLFIAEGYQGKTKITFDANAADSFNYIEHKNKREVQLIWSNFNLLNPELKIVATINLEKETPFSSWKIAVEGLTEFKLAQLTYPIISNIADLGNEELVIPEWMGSLTRDPRSYYAKNSETTLTLNYPDHLAMQFFALYNPTEIGLYYACDDSLAYAKKMIIRLDQNKSLGLEAVHIPEFSDHLRRYEPSYSVRLGTFQGDWQDAAEIYAQWGRKQWWAQQSRLKNANVTEWLINTGAWVWNRGRATNVLDPATTLGKELKLPANVLWHWWHGGSYDDSFPDYFPPRDGNTFISKIDQAKKNNVNALVYMNQLKWGSSMPSWIEEKAYLSASKNINGQLESHMYNIFTKKSLTYMCLATDFWKAKYASLVDSAINKYHVSGIYMDQTCLSRVCYDPNHDHPVGGGNYWMKHVKLRDELNRSQPHEPKEAAFAGEGAGEAWLPYIDAFLTLGVSKERYAGVKGPETIPLFQAVYHEYAVTFGNYSSLLTPPYDEMWPKEFAPANAETLLDPRFNRQFLMEQARSFVWGMQPMIANYQPFLKKERAKEMTFFSDVAKVRYRALKFLLYGRYMKNLKLDVPNAVYDMSKLSIYAGQNEKVTAFSKEYPNVYQGTWKSSDGNIGLSLANIQEDKYKLVHQLNAADYGLPNNGSIYMIEAKGKTKVGNYVNGKVNLDVELKGMSVCVIEIGN